MSGRRGAAILAETLRTSGAVMGPARVVVPVLRGMGATWQHDARRGQFLVPLASFDDVLVQLELAGHAVEIVGASLW